MQIPRFAFFVAISCIAYSNALAVPVVAPFINELHYDNSGSDVNEFIEIAGTAQSLLGFSIVLYNGGTGASYRNVPLQAEIPDQSNGFGAVSVFVNGLQNGPADGIALVDGMNQVFEWLSYEGQLLALDGPVMGLLSNPLTVSEPPNTGPGQSLQRTGIGLTGNDFDWTGPVDESPGAINVGQQFGASIATVPEPTPLLPLGLGLTLIAAAKRKTAQ